MVNPVQQVKEALLGRGGQGLPPGAAQQGLRGKIGLVALVDERIHVVGAVVSGYLGGQMPQHFGEPLALGFGFGAGSSFGGLGLA